MNHQTIKNRVLAILMFAAFTAPIFAAPPVSLAQNASEKEYTLLAPLPCIPTAELPCGGSGGAVIKPSVTFRTYVQYAMNIMIALAAVAAVVMIVWGGLLYMTTTAVSGKTEGLDKVKNALYGLLLVLASYLILKTIDPRLVQIPGTLVPNIGEKLKDLSVSTDYLSQFERDANLYRVESIALGENVREAKDTIALSEPKLKEIDQKLNDIYSGAIDATQEEINKLSVERQQLINAIATAKEKYNVADAQVRFNGVLGTAISTASNPQYSAQDAIENIVTTDMARLNALRDVVIADMQRDGQYDHSAVNAYANYAETRLELLVAEEMMISTEKTVNPGTSRRMIIIARPDGSGSDTFTDNNTAKAYIQTQIEKAKTGSLDLSPELRTDMDDRIKTLEASLSDKFK